MKKIIIATITMYQKTLSPDHGWFSGGRQRVCRFHPTCSQYTKEAVEKYGSIKGSYMGVKRIARCNPWNKGGYDPVPKKENKESDTYHRLKEKGI